jgi:hypothetical protein
MENLSEFQIMWIAYVAGALGCCLSTWLLFRRAGRAWVHFFVITVMVLLLTPYAIDAETMLMAPAIYSLFFGYLDGGFETIKPVVRLMLGVWVLALVMSLVYQLLTRHRQVAAPIQAPAPHEEEYHDPSDVLLAPRAPRNLSSEESQARDDLMNEEPIRAIR